VLKGCDRPFVSVDRTNRYIKMQKDYIRGLGDTADLAIVGGRRDAKDVAELRIGKLSWTTFYLGSLENKDDVRRFDVKPKFRIVDTINRYNISEDILYLNQRGNFCQLPFAFSRPELVIKLDQSQPLRPTELFKYPFVVEVMGAGFDKPANTRHYTLRFPRVQKIHDDRTYRDTVSFGELQDMARNVADPLQDDEDSQAKLRWVERLQSPGSEFDYSADRSTATARPQCSSSATTESTTLDFGRRYTGAKYSKT